ncbi:MAG: hypothetical protein ACM3ZA_11510 [Bacillota bacterium]
MTGLIITEGREQGGLGWLMDHPLEPWTHEVLLGSGDFTVQIDFADGLVARTGQVTGSAAWQKLSIVVLPRQGSFLELRLR